MKKQKKSLQSVRKHAPKGTLKPHQDRAVQGGHNPWADTMGP